MNIPFPYLRTLLKIAETRSFTGAARALAMTQPGVSQHIKALEIHFEARLVSRRGRRCELTAAGEQVTAYARDLFHRHEALRGRVRRDDPHAGVCRFMSPGSFGMLFYGFLLEMNSRYPELTIHFSYAPNPTITREVCEGTVDVGFVTRTPTESELEWRVLERERICLLAPAAFRPEGDLFPALCRLGFIDHPDGAHHAGRVLKENFPHQFHSMGDLRVRGFINQITRIPEPVALGLGFTALPELACRAFPEQAKLRYVKLRKPVEDPVCVISRRGRELPARFAFLFSEFEKWRRRHGAKRGRE